ncbi:MAG: heme-binding protein [Methyloversatilis sp.]|nr:heme-binding protein [Methyloversatilis sp.]MBP6193232.1 heme-binding protein [Methyloversatilis sp.]MBP9117805.1 heme-binding protein [Methyloversatilis sp.]
MMIKRVSAIAAFGAILAVPAGAYAGCSAMELGLHPARGSVYAQLKGALLQAVADETEGLDFDMWATIVDRDGVVCAVAFSGSDRGAQWPGSRVISAQKANTANAFSLNGLALSTANLYSAVQPGGSLYGLQHSNPVDTEAAYRGNPMHYGQMNDPMVGRRVGGVNVFGGGLGLYKGNVLKGAVGVSGDTSCADHNIGWRVRAALRLDQLAGVGGVSGDPARPDNIVYDIDAGTGKSDGGFGHPPCLNTGSNHTSLPVVK